ncbi:MAG TPA: S-layer homology domain-containing protein, partial [Thermoanaerobaculia bacterium]|nr:S-layer homology domain-containing protein [Thermoanaerobaculia bacterium]
RAQMAVFLLKASQPPGYAPPQCTGTVFNDVPCTGGAFDPWIEDLAGRGITGGCQVSPPLYCPSGTVTRAQMSAFLLKTEHGSAYVPPACTGIFGDVICPSLFADWIEQLAHEGVTAGCGNGNYCPASPVTRGQMAVFLVKTFNIPLP